MAQLEMRKPPPRLSSRDAESSDSGVLANNAEDARFAAAAAMPGEAAVPLLRENADGAAEKPAARAAVAATSSPPRSARSICEGLQRRWWRMSFEREMVAAYVS